LIRPKRIVNATTARAAAVQHKADLLRSLRLCTAEGIMAMPIVTMSLPVNVFMTALVAKAYPLPKTTIGLICALPFFGNFLQIFAAPFLAKWKPPKTITVLAATLHLLTWAAAGVLLPFVPRDNPTLAGQCFIAWFLLSSCFAAVAGVSWNAWIQEWVPARLRGKYFGRRNGTLQVSTLTFLLVAGWALAQWNYAIPVFQVIILAAVVMRVFSLRWQWQSPTRARKHAVTARSRSATSSASSPVRVRSFSSSRSAPRGRLPPIASDRSTTRSCSMSSASPPSTSACSPPSRNSAARSRCPRGASCSIATATNR
jgi:hypothetical protein